MSLIGPRPEVLDRVGRYRARDPRLRRAPRDASGHHRLGAGQRPAGRSQRVDRPIASARPRVPARVEPARSTRRILLRTVSTVVCATRSARSGAERPMARGRERPNGAPQPRRSRRSRSASSAGAASLVTIVAAPASSARRRSAGSSFASTVTALLALGADLGLGRLDDARAGARTGRTGARIVRVGLDAPGGLAVLPYAAAVAAAALARPRREGARPSRSCAVAALAQRVRRPRRRHPSRLRALRGRGAAQRARAPSRSAGRGGSRCSPCRPLARRRFARGLAPARPPSAAPTVSPSHRAPPTRARAGAAQRRTARSRGSRSAQSLPIWIGRAPLAPLLQGRHVLLRSLVRRRRARRVRRGVQVLRGGDALARRRPRGRLPAARAGARRTPSASDALERRVAGSLLGARARRGGRVLLRRSAAARRGGSSARGFAPRRRLACACSRSGCRSST